ncbi:MAG: hypothetical protein ACRD0B_04210 [Acidimicrobiales bacterium]
MDQTAISSPARPGGEFFATPSTPLQRRYEALRAYLYEGRPAPEAAARFGYSTASLLSAARDFRAGPRDFFRIPRPGPRSAPAKEAARARVVELRRQGYSAYEIAAALAATDTPLNRTGVAEVLAEEGLPRLWPRPYAARGGPRRERLRRAEVIDFATLPPHSETRVAGLLLAIPELVELDLPALVAAAGYPGTSVIPALSSIASLLALKLVAMRRVSHVDDIAVDVGAGLFAGLTALPKATALSTYSYRLDHRQQRRLLQALGQAMTASGLAAGEEFDLDFHAVMHWGEDVALEKHYVPKRSQRTRSVLTFFAQDGATHNLVYANADLYKASQAGEVVAFCDHWRSVTGHDPGLLVFDSKLTTQEMLGRLDARGVRFLTLRMRSPSLAARIAALPASAWRTVALDRDGDYRKPQVAEDSDVRLSDYPGTVRQLVIRGLGREAPTVLITNDRAATTKTLIERYARRMTIEQRLAEAIRSFHIDALASAVPLNVDLDVVLSVLASAVCGSLRRRLRGYETATPDTLQRRFLSTGGLILNRRDEIVVQLARRTYSPVLRAADLPTVAVPWWEGRRLRFEFA